MSRSTNAVAPADEPTPSNRLGLDYAVEADRFRRLPWGIIDVHAHVNGDAASALMRRAMTLYGVESVWSMTRLEECEIVRDRLDGAVRFIAVPDFGQTENRRHHHGLGYLPRIDAYRALGSRIAKFWAAPRARDYAREMGDPDFMNLDAPHRVAAMEHAQSLGMALMVHVADPDTWFAGKYADAATYGTKRDQYVPFERLLDRFEGPWIAAHFGGWPEDLAFIADLLDRHPNLRLDASATKWMVRELSRHGRDELLEFLRRYRGRVMFGSDIVTTDDHLRAQPAGNEMQAKASSRDEAFDLYASRYWALRTLYESEYDGASPIADPDLALVAPERHDPMDAPPLRGKRLPDDVLQDLYRDAALGFLADLGADD